jgi:hypothetical protein
MKLVDLRKLAIRKQVEIRFTLANGMICVVDVHGLARIPGLKGPSDFNVEEEFARAESVFVAGNEITRAALEQMTKSAPETSVAVTEE